MNVSELRDMEEAELLTKVKQLKEELFHFRCQLAMGRIENPMRIRQTKHDVARVMTVIRQRALAGNTDAASPGVG
ncbi:MAG: 50S ribosomal protein L29 [Nitrospirales bacterium]|nr:MAG: 50S ribosomal protein L29 [Nitrospirales bacterium]